MATPHRVAVIGAGLSGLCAARYLHQNLLPLSLTIFEKSRSRGGRLATKTNFPPTAIDHGAPFFALSPASHGFLSALLPTDALKQLPADAIQDGEGSSKQTSSPLYFCEGGNSLIGSTLAEGLSVIRATTSLVTPAGTVFSVPYEEDKALEYGPFDLVIVSVPLPQAAKILCPPKNISDQWETSFTPTLTALFTYDLRRVPEASLVHQAIAGKPPYAIDTEDMLVACETYKRPNDSDVAVLIAHTSKADSVKHVEEDGEVWLPPIRERAEALWKIPSGARINSFAKRWRYARVRQNWNGADRVCAWMKCKLLLTGDGVCGESEVSAAVEDGLRTGKLAESILKGHSPTTTKL